MRRLGRVLYSGSLLPAASPAPQLDVGGWELPSAPTHPLVTRVFAICGSQAPSHPHWPGASVGLRPALTSFSAPPPTLRAPPVLHLPGDPLCLRSGRWHLGLRQQGPGEPGAQGGPDPARKGETPAVVCGGQAFGAPPGAGLVGRPSGGGGRGWGWVCPGHDTVPGEPGEGTSPGVAPLCL